MGRSKNISDETRIKIVRKYEAGRSNKEIAAELEVNVYTVGSILKVYKDTGRTTNAMKNSGRQYALNEHDKNFIRELIEEKNSITLKSIKQNLERECGKRVSISTIDRSIDAFNYSFKRTVNIPEARNNASNIAVRRIYAEDFMRKQLDRMIFLDETGFNLSMRNAYGRSLKGTAPKNMVRTLRSKNFTVSAAMMRTGTYMFESLQGAYNGNEFLGFITRLIEKLNLDDLKEMVFVMDNVRFHHMTIIKDAIQSAGHEILYLPPYSPQLHPIEEMFCKWKGLVKKC